MGRSSSDWALLARFIGKLGEGYSSVFVPVHLINDLLNFLETDEVAPALDHSSELMCTYGTRIIEIKRIEGLVSIESWSGRKSLTKGFGSILASNVGSPHALEFESGVW